MLIPHSPSQYLHPAGRGEEFADVRVIEVPAQGERGPGDAAADNLPVSGRVAALNRRPPT
jgi:hypothetical protein